MLIISFSGLSQIQKGTIIAGGNVGFSTGNNTSEPSGFETTFTTLNLSPDVGIFVTDGFAAGLNLNISTSSGEDDDNDKSTFTSFSGAPWVRLYSPSGLFGEVSYGIGSVKSTFESGSFSSESKSNLTTWYIGGGYAIFVSNSVAIEPLVRYSQNQITDSDNSDLKDKTGGLEVRIGFNIYLAKGGE